MKRFLAKDSLLLMLPVFLLAGVAWWKRGGEPLLDAGPYRLEVSPPAEYALTPLDIADGFNWACTMSAATKGKIDLPSKWQYAGGNRAPTQETGLFYRSAGAWKKLPQGAVLGPMLWFDLAPNGGSPIFKVNLRQLSPQVEELRLRGRLRETRFYVGPVHPTWIPPRNVEVIGANRVVWSESQPLDILVWKKGQTIPTPAVSQPEIALVDAQWFTDPDAVSQADQFFVCLRHLKQSNWENQGSMLVRKAHFYDGDGKEIVLFDKLGKGSTRWFSDMTMMNPQLFSRDKRASDRIIAIPPSNYAPPKPWLSYKQPLRSEFEVSDGQCWPAKISITWKNKVAGRQEYKEFGGPR